MVMETGGSSGVKPIIEQTTRAYFEHTALF